MAQEIPPVCSACHAELGPPDDEVAHPDDDNPPENAHFKIQIRSDGEERMQCTETGQLASVLKHGDEDHPMVEGEGVGGVGENSVGESQSPAPGGPQHQQPDQSPGGSAEVFDLEEDKDQIDILMDVVRNPSYGLSDEQIEEVRAWAHDYGGQMPPEALQRIVELMSGVQKQTAQLVKERYELKLNKWVREQTSENSGPLIGSTMPQAPTQSGGGQPQPDVQSGPSPEAIEAAKREEERERQRMEMEQEPPSRRERMQSRRNERVDRRDEVIDTFAEELAQGTAQNLSNEAGEGLVRMRNLALTVLESKARKDPDWFFEIADRLDMDPVELLEPSESRRQEMQSGGSQTQAQVDDEIDDVMSRIQGNEDGGGTPEQEMDAVSESVKEEPPQSINERTQNAQQELEEEQDDGENGEEEEAFEEIFG